MSKVTEAAEVLTALGLPKAQQNDRSALTLLALAGIKPTTASQDAQARVALLEKALATAREWALDCDGYARQMWEWKYGEEWSALRAEVDAALSADPSPLLAVVEAALSLDKASERGEVAAYASAINLGDCIDALRAAHPGLWEGR